MELTKQNEKRLIQLVDEYARKGNWPGVIRIIGGAGKADLADWSPADDADAERGAPNFQ